ncbi:MAG: 16S rRNA (guanine(527)-N(7))-methyltransferase RsmG [Acidimicrobiia bacterium]
MEPFWVRAARFSGLDPDSSQIDQMTRYGLWLATEARDAGGIGPGEIDRIERRHLADSMLFASQLSSAPGEVWDLGSGVGLPGIPLAVCMPETRFLLIDRSGRRVDLLGRAIRILDLENCEVEQGEINQLDGEVETVVSRASLPPGLLTPLVTRLLIPGGMAVVGGSWRAPPDHPGWETAEIPRDLLDHTVWLLIMRRT